MRTGLTALGAWVAVEKLLADTMPSWSVHTIAVTLLAFALSSFLLGLWRYYRTSRKLRTGFAPMFPATLLACLTALLLVATFTAIAAMVIEKLG